MLSDQGNCFGLNKGKRTVINVDTDYHFSLYRLIDMLGRGCSF